MTLHTHPLHRISGPKGFDFPLLIIRHEPQVRDIPTYETLPRILDWTTTHFLRVFVGIEEALGVEVLDLVDPWPKLSVFEDLGRGRSHGQSEYDNVGDTSRIRCVYILSYAWKMCTGHTFCTGTYYIPLERVT